jgi:hypothetical protein
MATLAQINANRENAKLSTGPRTEAGKAASSRNRLTLGLYTREDYVKPEERDLYKEFCDTMLRELAPVTVLEQSLASEITGASWRLRRCAAADAELADYAETDPLLDDTKTKTIRSIERARAAAHSVLHRSINQLRKLQADRPAAPQPEPQPEPAPAPEPAPTPVPASNCKPGRNAPCPCNSGRKYKQCCLRRGPAWQPIAA